MTTTRSLGDWLRYIEGQHPQAVDMGLDRVRAVAARMQLGRPATHVVTVAGSNGKGSTVAFIDAIARRRLPRGCQHIAVTAAYTSACASAASLCRRCRAGTGFDAVEAARGDTTLTYFE